MPAALLVLDNPLQNYAWGSRTAIASFLGQPAPSAQPEAELWIGAHPKAPSRIVHPAGLGTLERAIADDPVGLLGRDVCDRFDHELPFLFKVLAAARPLSIQAHPNQEQARAGFARENAAGLPLDSPRRNYRDVNHKPELVCALTPFEALKGFRASEAIVHALGPVAGHELEQDLRRLCAPDTPARLRRLLERLLTIEGDERRALLERAASEAHRRAGADRTWLWVSRLLEKHPGDTGVLAPLYLNLLTLQPGESLYLPAGELHAYLEGTALEIMANSDNVLRGGLTAKHVDVAELLATLVFEHRPPEVLRPADSGPGERTYRTPAREFELEFIEVHPGRAYTPRQGRGLEVLLGVEGDASILVGGAATSLARGRSVLVPASLPDYELQGEGRVARACVPASAALRPPP